MGKVIFTGLNVLKSQCIVTWLSKYTRALTFENILP